MKRLNKRLSWLLSWLWFLDGMSLMAVLVALKSGQGWFLPALRLLITSLAIWQWEGIRKFLQDKLTNQ